MRKGNRGFTLVELIVVITILAILGTIAFISLQGHSRNARDSVRVSDMASIHKGLGVVLVRGGIVPVPENNIEIHSSGTVIGYQGDAAENVLSAIGMIARGGKDPVDQTYYSYMTNKNLSSYQLLGYLEAGTEITFDLFNQAGAVEYNTKFKKVEGDALGILTQDTTEIPIHRVDSLITAGNLDVKTTTDSYVANFDDTITVSGTGTSINTISNVLVAGGGKNVSCRYIKLLNPDTPDGVYKINPTGGRGTEFDVYCDMTTDGGGWTMVWKNFGGPSHASHGTNISNASLWTSSTYNLVKPFSESNAFGSEVSQHWPTVKDQTNIEWLKISRVYDGTTLALESSSSNNHMRFDFGTDVSFQHLIDAATCSQLNNQVTAYVDGVYKKQTDYVYGFADGATIGLASDSGTTLSGQQPDSCGETDADNLIDSSGTSSRHMISYRTNDTGTNVTRCQFICWSGEDAVQEVIWGYRER